MAHADHTHEHTKLVNAPVVRNPVCGMSVDRATAKYMSKHTRERFYFCVSGCRAKFENEPEKYLEGAPSPGINAGMNIIYLPYGS